MPLVKCKTFIFIEGNNTDNNYRMIAGLCLTEARVYYIIVMYDSLMQEKLNNCDCIVTKRVSPTQHLHILYVSTDKL